MFYGVRILYCFLLKYDQLHFNLLIKDKSHFFKNVKTKIAEKGNENLYEYFKNYLPSRQFREHGLIVYKTIRKMFSKFMNLFNRITFDISKYTYI